MMEDLMDAKYNRLLDNALVRIGVNALIFTVWLGVSYGLLRFAM